MAHILEPRFDYEECARKFIARQTMCFGCAYSSRCGIGAWSARRMGEFLRKIDPDGKNITVIELRPLGQ